MTFQEFLHMGGYALYVWTSYGLSLGLLLALPLLAAWRQRKLLRQLAAQSGEEA